MDRPALLFILLCALNLSAAQVASAAALVPGEAPALSGGPVLPMPRLNLDEGPAAPRATDERPIAPSIPRAGEGRDAPPFIPPTSVQPAAPRLAPAVDVALQSELARLRAAADGGPRGRGRGTQTAGQAAWQLGLAALHGVAGPVQPHEAREWFARSLRLGEPLAAAGLAWCAIDGCGSPPDPATARRWIAALRPVDGPRSQYLEWLLQERLAPVQLAPSGRPPGQPRPGESTGDTSAGLRGRSLLVAAARGGNVHAAIELGLDSATHRSFQEALEHFRAAAPNSPAAAFNAGALARQQGQPQPDASPAAGADTFARAQRVHRGEGQPANFTEAIRLYRLAQSQGSVPARRMLELIFSRPAADGAIDIAWMQQLAQVSVANESPRLNAAGSQPQLRREPTPLSDLLPQRWRAAADADVR